jgi:hypothetical protein
LEIEDECLQITKADKYGFGGRLPGSTFDGTLIGDMSLDKSPAEGSWPKGLGATSAANPNIFGTAFKSCHATRAASTRPIFRVFVELPRVEREIA